MNKENKPEKDDFEKFAEQAEKENIAWHERFERLTQDISKVDKGEPNTDPEIKKAIEDWCQEMGEEKRQFEKSNSPDQRELFEWVKAETELPPMDEGRVHVRRIDNGYKDCLPPGFLKIHATLYEWLKPITKAKISEQISGYVHEIDSLRETNRKLGEKLAAITKAKPIEVYKFFQNDVSKWLLSCFGEEISNDKVERNHRFLEEALELVQSLGCEKSEASQLVDYVFDREIGEPIQETGGVMVTLAALCFANKIDMKDCGYIELNRVWDKIDKIREKQAAKPKHSPLPTPPNQNNIAKVEVYIDSEIEKMALMKYPIEYGCSPLSGTEYDPNEKLRTAFIAGAKYKK